MTNTNPDNYLLENSFSLSLSKFPQTQYYVQSFQLPGIEVSANPVQTPFGNIPTHGSISYSFVAMTFKIDEELKAYKEMVNWIKDTTMDVDFNTRSQHTSDATLTILNNNNNKMQRVKFYDIVPRTISALPFSSIASDPLQLIATVMFEISRFDFID